MVKFMKYVQDLISEYKPIEIIYTKDNKVSPLQRWLDRIIDLDKIIEIQDVQIEQSKPFLIGDCVEYIGLSIFIRCMQNDTKNNIGLIFPLKKSGLREVTKAFYEENWLTLDYAGELSRIGYRYFEKFYETEKYKSLFQTTILDNLISVWRKYKEDLTC